MPLLQTLNDLFHNEQSDDMFLATLVNYERQNSIVSIGDKESVTQARLDDLNKNLTATQTERLQKQSVYEMVQSNESLVSFLEQNGLLSRLEEKESDLKGQYAEAL